MAAPLYARYVPTRPAKANETNSSSHTIDSAFGVKRKRDADKVLSKNTFGKMEVRKVPKVLASNGSEFISHAEKSSTSPNSIHNVHLRKSRSSYPENNDNKNLHRNVKNSRYVDQKTRGRKDSSMNADLSKHPKMLHEFHKAAHKSQIQKRRNQQEAEHDSTAEPVDLKDLVPIPVPEVSRPDEEPSYRTLPSWLSAPEVVDPQELVTFSALGLDPTILTNLSQRNIRRTFPIQSAALKLLNPGENQHPGDLCIEAATGSGKTLAYVLPIVQDLKRHVTVDLRAVIVVPTRELVNQVREVIDICVDGSAVKVGTAIGNKTFRDELKSLVNLEMKYDPQEYLRLKAEHSRLFPGLVGESGDFDDEDAHEVLGDLLDTRPLHIPVYKAKVHILVCTPGRLVEHLKSPKSFTLENLKWLVLDEVDRLLDQSFQQFVSSIHESIEIQKTHNVCKDDTINREYNLRMKQDVQSRIRKIVLSATMTRDMHELGTLNLRNPKLLRVDDANANQETDNANIPRKSLQFNLPQTLEEFAVSVGDGSEKPLYLCQLLRAKSHPQDDAHHPEGRDRTPPDSAESSTVSSSDLSEDSSIESSTSPSDTSESEELDLPSNKLDSLRNGLNGAISSESSSTASRMNEASTRLGQSYLVFASSTESATRLQHVLGSLEPSWVRSMFLLTKSSSPTQKKKMAKAMNSTDKTLQNVPTIIICTDRASRGLDLPGLSYVVNYDLPHDLTGYIHRVGRTARAGNEGQAWTLVAHREARWFWNSIARTPEMFRGGRKVQRKTISIEDLGSDIQHRYEQALQKLKQDVVGDSRHS